MDYWKLTKGMFKEFHFFNHDIDGLAFGKRIRYVRPFILTTAIVLSVFGTVCEDNEEFNALVNKWKF